MGLIDIFVERKQEEHARPVRGADMRVSDRIRWRPAREPARRLTPYASRLTPALDSGMVSRYQEAPKEKPAGIRGLIRSLSSAFQKAFRRPPAGQTTEKGSASFASPTIGQISLYALRYERRAKIADCRQMVLDDPRARKSTVMFAREAIRKGFTINVNQNAARGVGAQRYKTADAAAKKIMEVANKEIFSWAWMTIVEGEAFIQAIFSDDGLVDVKRMPAAAMERNTDDTDEFVDPFHAFSQVDVLTNEEVATFPLAFMWHGRWCHVDGERYGEPELIAGRRLRRLVELQEEAQAMRRLTRASQKRFYHIGTPEKPGEKDQVDEFREQNGFVEGKQDAFDPMNTVTDIFDNGLGSVDIIDGDAEIDSIDDLRYAQDVYAMSLPTPKAMMGLDSESINRDVLEDQRAEWLKQTQILSDLMVECVSWLMDISLLKKGILPEAITYAVHFSESTIERPTEVVDRVLKLRANALPNFQPDPLITKRRAIQTIADLYDIDDVDQEMEDIERELALLAQEQAQQMAQAQMIQQSAGMGAEGGGAEGGGNFSEMTGNGPGMAQAAAGSNTGPQATRDARLPRLPEFRRGARIVNGNGQRNGH